MREDAHNEDPDEKGHVYTDLLDVPAAYNPNDDDDDEFDDDGDYYMDEAAKPDFLDLDGDGNETESMKSAAADSTSHGNFINKSRAKSHLTKKDDHIYGHDASGNVTKLNSPSDADNAKYKKFTIKSKDDLSESFNKRMLRNLHGHEYILREAFKRK